MKPFNFCCGDFGGSLAFEPGIYSPRATGLLVGGLNVGLFFF